MTFLKPLYAASNNFFIAKIFTNFQKTYPPISLRPAARPIIGLLQIRKAAEILFVEYLPLRILTVSFGRCLADCQVVVEAEEGARADGHEEEEEGGGLKHYTQVYHFLANCFVENGEAGSLGLPLGER